MDLPVSSWHEAVIVRKSRRSFIPGRPVAADQLERLERFVRTFRPFSGARSEIVRESPDAVLKGLIGGYGRISGAPAYAVILGTPSLPNAAAQAGYTGEGLILEATALGLGTCWVSGMFKDDHVRRRVSLSDGERVYAVTPIGLGERDYSFKEKLYSGAIQSRKRKPREDLIEGCSPLPWQDLAIEAARAAPSARNRQPWRFLLAPDSITVLRDPGPDGDKYPKSLDCGIAMLHLELGARAGGVSGAWTFLCPPAVARFDIL